MHKIVNDEKMINNEIFMDYFGHFVPSILAKRYIKPIKLKIRK